MIIASAIRFFFDDDAHKEFPVIMTGKRHADIFEKMLQMGIKYQKESQIQGFITDNFRFLDRFDGLKEAKTCNQIFSKESICGNQLFSEDIWPE